MNNKELDILAKQTAKNWSGNCFDEDFIDCCADDLCGQGLDGNTINTILDIIENKYLNL